MSLYEVETRFKTHKMLSDFIDLAKHRFHEAKQKGYSHYLYEFMPSFTFGRRAGHTTAVRDYIERNTSNELVMIHIVHSESWARAINKNLKIKDEFIFTPQSFERKIRGISGFPFCYGFKRVGFIFDSINCAGGMADVQRVLAVAQQRGVDVEWAVEAGT